MYTPPYYFHPLPPTLLIVRILLSLSLSFAGVHTQLTSSEAPPRREVGRRRCRREEASRFCGNAYVGASVAAAANATCYVWYTQINKVFIAYIPYLSQP
jgi:hypothetical protein